MRKIQALIVFFIFAALASSCGGIYEQESGGNPLSDADGDSKIIRAAKDAYVFGFPLVYGEIMKTFMTNPLPGSSNKPVNVFSHASAPADDKFKNFPYPDRDMIYSFVWIDVSKEPLLFEIPFSQQINSSFVIFNAWSDLIASSRADFADVKRVFRFAVSGPGWAGTLPEGFKEIRSHTSSAFFVYGVKVSSSSGFYETLNKHRQSFKTSLLSSYGKIYIVQKMKYSYNDSLSKEPPLKQMQALPVSEFFNMLNSLMLSNPPFERDADTLDNTLDIGVAPGMRFDPEMFSDAVMNEIKYLPEQFFISDNIVKDGGQVWNKLPEFKNGSGYYARAKAAFKNISASIDPQALRFIAVSDAENAELDAQANKYLLRFSKNNFPKAGVSWTAAVYDADGFLIKNPANKYSLGYLNNLKKNKDGSVDIFIQKTSPGKSNESNWLAANGVFKIVLKISPSPSATPFDETKLPEIMKRK
ncbi:MAG: DUF1214 domain-containing protein [Endomicrobium sp.]|jgi:DNA sulfur modification protein DndE|nr:DUF1214 domain-containing protein [Endomicrobium sp.]